MSHRSSANPQARRAWSIVLCVVGALLSTAAVSFDPGQAETDWVGIFRAFHGKSVVLVLVLPALLYFGWRVLAPRLPDWHGASSHQTKSEIPTLQEAYQ